MNKTLRVQFTGTLLLLLLSVLGYSQTTISTLATAATTTTSPGVVTFGVRNTNSFPIAVTDVAAFLHTNNNGKTYTVWYHPTALTGVPSVNATNGWQQLGISPIMSPTVNGVNTLLTNKYLVIPANTTYRFAVAINSGSMYYGASATNTWSSGGVDIITGNNAVSPGYAGTFPSPTTTPATFAGSITYVTAAANNITTLSVVQPLANAQFCSYTPTLVRAVIRNVGTIAQTNIPVSAVYTSAAATATVSGFYTGTLQPFTSDTVVIGTILPPAGFQYSIRAYSQLATDNVYVNDTTPGAVSFTYKAVVPTPVVFDDTVCLNGDAFVGIAQTQPSTIYRWYSAPAGGSLVNISNTLTLPALTQDSIMYISGLTGGCESDRVPVHAIIGPPPTLNLPDDTSFCESIPLILDAGNAGGSYLWSTGDTTQTITVTNVSGIYTVIVDKYCIGHDTIDVTIAPLPTVSGVSYIKLGNTYHFNASTVQFVTNYLWLFGDGNTSTDPTPIYTYAGGGSPIDYDVVLVVSNDCGTDTARRTVTVGLDDVELNASVSAYPNPAVSQLKIKSDVALINEVYIMDMLGNIVSKSSYAKATEATLNVQQLASGNYILSIRTTEGTANKPLQIQR